MKGLSIATGTGNNLGIRIKIITDRGKEWERRRVSPRLGWHRSWKVEKKMMEALDTSTLPSLNTFLLF